MDEDMHQLRDAQDLLRDRLPNARREQCSVQWELARFLLMDMGEVRCPVRLCVNHLYRYINQLESFDTPLIPEHL